MSPFVVLNLFHRRLVPRLFQRSRMTDVGECGSFFGGISAQEKFNEGWVIQLHDFYFATEAQRRGELFSTLCL